MLVGLGIEVSNFAGFVETVGSLRRKASVRIWPGRGILQPNLSVGRGAFQGRQHLPLLRSLLDG